MAFQSNLNGFVQEVRRFNEETSVFIDQMLHTLRNMEAAVDNKMNLIADVIPSTASDGSEANGTQGQRAGSESNGRRVAVKRRSGDPDDNDSPIKKPRIDNEVDAIEASDSSNAGSRNDSSVEASETSHEGGHNESSEKAPKVVDDGVNGHRSVMHIKANMGKYGTLEYLNHWLARVYERTTKFYTIKKYSRMGTFMFYVAIDVNLDETKDDLHVVINSDNLDRPDVIFQFIENCFQDRKVVTLLHIVTSDEPRLREDPVRLEKMIRTMVEPIFVHL
ncbi:uncharacterized protein LOC119078973 [Bradysia coprophila]|uniref:uncharacterized protein LOC119078973 n=1 Tax=Bradysia coprophila TaxID=38358 RepID=UPI00187D7014|nr:uncharacterized protein LOC119078973 [Bradysia coprophila]